MSNDTRWPSARLRSPAASTAVACTNTSLPPPSGEMKPKPFCVLKNFTVPIIDCSLMTQIEFRQSRMLERGDKHLVIREVRLSQPGGQRVQVGPNSWTC